jgi:small-conductance mechanosensitive channel
MNNVDVFSAVSDPLTSLGLTILNFIPELVASVVILVVGVFVALVLSRLVTQIINALKIDSILAKAGIEKYLQRTGLQLNSGKFLGEFVKWFLFFVFLVAAADILGLDRLSEFLLTVINYLPDVLVAVLILLVGLIAAHFLHRFVMHSVKAAGLMSAKFLAGAARWVIIIFAILAALSQLGIAQYFISTLFTGFVAAAAIALGLAFGLGGKDTAKDLIDDIRKK